MKFLFSFLDWVVCVFFHGREGYDYIKTITRDGCEIVKRCKKCGRAWREPC